MPEGKESWSNTDPGSVNQETLTTNSVPFSEDDKDRRRQAEKIDSKEHRKYHLLDNPEIRLELCARTIDLAQYIVENQITTVFFLDKSARPISYLLRRIWQHEYPAVKKPRQHFVKIGRHNYQGESSYSSNSASMIGDLFDQDDNDRFSKTWLEELDMSNTEDRTALEKTLAPDRPGYFAELHKTFEIQDNQTPLEKERVLLVDDYENSGKTLLLAQRIFAATFGDELATLQTYTFVPKAEDDSSKEAEWWNYTRSVSRRITSKTALQNSQGMPWSHGAVSLRQGGMLKRGTFEGLDDATGVIDQPDEQAWLSAPTYRMPELRPVFLKKKIHDYLASEDYVWRIQSAEDIHNSLQNSLESMGAFAGNYPIVDEVMASLTWVDNDLKAADAFCQANKDNPDILTEGAEQLAESGQELYTIMNEAVNKLYERDGESGVLFRRLLDILVNQVMPTRDDLQRLQIILNNWNTDDNFENIRYFRGLLNQELSRAVDEFYTHDRYGSSTIHRTWRSR